MTSLDKLIQITKNFNKELEENAKNKRIKYNSKGLKK